MFKLAIPMLLLGTTALPADDSTDTAFVPSAIDGEAVQTLRVNPDADHADRCEDDPVLVEGAEGEARMFRDPARPDSLKPMHAVDYEVNGCALLVMTDGTLLRPEATEAPVRVQPAQ